MLPKKDDGAKRPALELNPDLAALGAAAAAVDQETAYTDIPNGAAGPQVEEGTNYVMEAQQMCDMVGALAVGFCPAAAPLWSPAITSNMARSLGPVLEKYNFTMGGAGVELVALMACGPVLWQTARLIGEQIRRDRAAPQAAQAAQPEAPAGETTPPTMPQMDLYKDGAGNTMKNFPDM